MTKTVRPKINFTDMVHGNTKFTPSLLFLIGTMTNFIMNIRKFNVPDTYTYMILVLITIISTIIASM